MSEEPAKQRVMKEFDWFIEVLREKFIQQLASDSRRRWDLKGTIAEMTDGELAFYCHKMDEMQDSMVRILADQWTNLSQSIQQEQERRGYFTKEPDCQGNEIIED
jgi:hypothetical protein